MNDCIHEQSATNQVRVSPVNSRETGKNDENAHPSGTACRDFSVPTDETVHELTRGMKNLEDPAWAEFHHLYQRRLFALHLRLAYGDLERAADNCQESMLRVVRHIRVFRTEQSFWSWLACLSRCTAIDAARRSGHHSRLMERFSHYMESMRQSRSTSEGMAEEIIGFLDGLEGSQKQLANLRFHHGFTVREIAEKLSISTKTVEARLTLLNKSARHWLARGEK